MKRFLVLFVLMLTLMLMVSVNGTYAGSQKSAGLQGMSSLSGKVVEMMNSGGYTYVNIEKDGKKTWVAVPRMKVVVGQDISFQPGMAMSNFTSKTLERTFETIVFSSGAIGQHATKSISGPVDNKQAEVSMNMAINVEKASGPDAYTVAGLYEKSAELDRKNVVIRGRVVKFSANIMGKNWIHIQDGSGNPSKGTNDIPVTSQDILSVGDIVTVKGTLYKDKDFGSGYKYAVIVEQATIKK
ncbi:MAG TPA: DNA-binding protein [Nitrospirae bacterium]|nr:DNA-binding protein [Nitrospirota bacterium]